MAKQILKIYEKKIQDIIEGDSPTKSATYILTGNQFLKTNKERRLSTISYLLEKGVGYVNVMYFAGFDGLELDANHPFDMISNLTSSEELKEILARADKNAFPRFITSVDVEGENVMLDVLPDGRILAQPNEALPKVEDAAWKLEEYFED